MRRVETAERYDLTGFTLRDMTLCGQVLRGMAHGATSMEEVAGRVARHFYDHLVDGASGARACALVRFFKTHAYGALGPDLRRVAQRTMGGGAPAPEMKCLTLLGTAGDEPDWSSRRASRSHQAIPLPSETAVQEIPMLRHLIAQLGLSVSMVVRPDPALLLDMERRTYSVFLVPEAVGSPFIPAQDAFVVPHGIRSVLGFGGALPSGGVFIVVLFLRIPVVRETAELFRNLSLNVKLAVLPFEGATFTPPGAAR
jgi:hypothetical protein